MPTERALPPLPEGAFAGLAAFTDALRLALDHAAHHAWPELIWSDSDFEDWPLGDSAVEASLQQWAKRGQRLTLLATGFEPLQRRQHRFVRFRRQWSHLVECRVASRQAATRLPSAWWSAGWVLQRHDPLRSLGTCSAAAAQRVLLREQLDGVLAQSRPGFPASTLGL
ncbi:MAG: hypothetical protein V4562_09665 [Pseudomonadota bacterium]